MSHLIKQAEGPATSTGRPDANVLDQLQDAWRRFGKNLSIGGGIGALLGGGTSAMVGGSKGETPAERRRRILRDALVGGAFGAGAGVALPAAADAFNTAAPAPSEAVRGAQAYAAEFAPDKPLGSGYTSATLGLGGLYGSHQMRGRSALGKMDTAVRGAASTFADTWNKAMAEGGKLTETALNSRADHLEKRVGSTTTLPHGLSQAAGNLSASQAVDRLMAAHRQGVDPAAQTRPVTPGEVPIERGLGLDRSTQLGHMRPLINQFVTNWGDMSLNHPKTPWHGSSTANILLDGGKSNIPLDARQANLMDIIDSKLNQDPRGMLDQMSARRPGVLNATKRILFPTLGRTHVYNGPERTRDFKAQMGWGGRAAGLAGLTFPFVSHYLAPMAPKIPEIVKATFDGVSPE